MSRFSICLAAAAIALTALMPLPAQAGSGDGYVEGGYGLGWYGGRPYYYTPFGAYGGNAYQFRSDGGRAVAKRYRYRNYDDR